MEKQLRIKSATGCVHVACDEEKHYSKTVHRTLCGHNDYFKSYGEGFWHDWPLTDDPVTCKRCIKLLKSESHKTIQIPIEDYEILKKIGEKLRKRLCDPRQKGAPDLTEDGKEWRFSFPPRGLMSPNVEEVQALVRFAGLDELKPVKYGEECKTCVHGKVESETAMLWPIGEDCNGCLGPQHQYHLPTIHWSVVWAAKNGYEYYEANGFVYIISDELIDKAHDIKDEDEDMVWKLLKKGKRICKLEHLNKLFVAANKR
jgi:hypothetical protein